MQTKPRRPTRKRAFETLEKLTSYYQAQLFRNEEAIDYLTSPKPRGRGFTLDTIRKWRLGYSPESETFGAFTITERKYLEFLGQTDYQGLDRFRGRVVFPICSDGGQPLGFSGRIIKGTHVSKYVNSPSHPWFRKGDAVYGLCHARRELLAKGKALVLEGYTDVIAAHQAGLVGSVSIMGTHFTTNQLLRLTRYTDELLVMFDGDSAGDAASERSMAAAMSMGIGVTRVSLPDGVDPDDFFIKQEGGGLAEEVHNRS